MTWHSALSLVFDGKLGSTRLINRHHHGALRVQKALYPESGVQSGICHVIMLYPPAGIALGDELSIEISLQNSAKAVMTTPGANKWYGTLASYSTPSRLAENLADNNTKKSEKNSNRYATQNVTVYLQDNSRFEWLPQENCFYDESHARSTNQFFLSQNASLIAWEINLLGREYHGERYDTGSMQLTNLFWRLTAEKPTLLLADTLNKSADDAWFSSQAGLNQHNVFATLWVIPAASEQCHILAWVNQLRLFIEQHHLPLTCTHTVDVLIIRYLGADVRQCFDAFGAIRGEVRLLMWQQDNHLPRIWAT